ncbi:MAG TPA: DUF6789 family protein [Bryobacteraceae bacterium]|nr:DUF6789 family protein [Bryobacteraceae bacterium]
MRPDNRIFQQAIRGGVIATAVLTVIMFLAPFAGLPNIDMAAAIGSRLMSHPALPFSLGWWAGLAIFVFMGGLVSPVVFVYARPVLLGNRWQRGAEWGVIIWVFAGTGVMVMMGVGFNEAHFLHPVSSVFSSLAGHVVYGAVLGLTASRA